MKQAQVMFGFGARPLVKDERGAVLIEMAVVLPVLLAIGLGVFEFGNIFYQYHLLSNAVRDAARYASGRTDDVCVANSAAQTAVKDIGLKNGVGQITPVFSISCSAGVANSTQYYRGPSTIRSVTVTGTVTYKSLGLLGFLNLTSPVLTVSHQERILGGR